MPLPRALRRLAPDRLRDDPRLRAPAVGSARVPPRTMHTEAEAGLLRSLARGAERVVEIGVCEGSSALVLLRALAPPATLHLVDPFGHQPGALRAGWAATAGATRRVVARAAAGGGPRVQLFHDARSAPGSPPGPPGPTAVLDDLFRRRPQPGWELAHEVDRAIAVRRVG